MPEFTFSCDLCDELIHGEGRNVREVKARHLLNEHDIDELEKYNLVLDIIHKEEYL